MLSKVKMRHFCRVKRMEIVKQLEGRLERKSYFDKLGVLRRMRAK